MDNLIQVTEPNPGGGANLVTTYTDNVLNKLAQVSMTRGTATQTRTFTYDDAGRVLTAANPENGTVTYTYDNNQYGNVVSRMDAKGQQTQYSYHAYGRLTEARHYPAANLEDSSQRIDFSYDTNPYNSQHSTNAWGRPTAQVFQ